MIELPYNPQDSGYHYRQQAQKEDLRCFVEWLEKWKRLRDLSSYGLRIRIIAELKDKLKEMEGK